MQQPKPAPHARKDSAGTISNFQARARGGLRDRTIGDERFSESNGTIKKRKVKEEEVIVISHASDIVISSSSGSSLQVKEEQIEPVKAAKVPVRKSTLSSGEVTNPICPKLSQILLIINFNRISSHFHFIHRDPVALCVCVTHVHLALASLGLLFSFCSALILLPLIQVTVICSSSCPLDPNQEVVGPNERSRHKTVPIF